MDQLEICNEALCVINDLFFLFGKVFVAIKYRLVSRSDLQIAEMLFQRTDP